MKRVKLLVQIGLVVSNNNLWTVLKWFVSLSLHPLGSSSSASSSDDEIKEAFESYKQRLVPLSAAVPSWNARDMRAVVFPKTMDPITSRPLRVVPSGHRKPKFFAQMSATPSERPYLDFNKMQHSKRVLMVRMMSVWLCTLQPSLVNNFQILVFSRPIGIHLWMWHHNVIR